MSVNPTDDFEPRLDHSRLEAARRADPLRYGLEPHEGLHLLWARVQAEPADEPWYRRLATPLRLGLSGAATAALALVLVVGLSNNASGPLPGAGPLSRGDDGGEVTVSASDSGSDLSGNGAAAEPDAGDGAEYAPSHAPAQPLGDPAASCIHPDELGGIAARDFAFDGTAVAIDGDLVTFAVHEHFIGDQTPAITVRTPDIGPASEALTGAPGIELGQRYLISGEEQTAWSCGFSLTYSPDVAREWATTTSGAD